MTDIMHETDFRVSTPTPQHRRELTGLPRYGEERSYARCTDKTGNCTLLCPRHRPAAWAEHMARHATDSI